MKVCIFKPRLDCTFKKFDGIVPEKIGEIPKIRIPFLQLVESINKEYSIRGDKVSVFEKPLWQFTPEQVKEIDADLTFIPHKEKHNFNVPEKKIQYYMQTVIPHYFSINNLGFLAGASYYPLEPRGDENSLNYEKLKERINLNMSKFYQPQRLYQKFPYRNYILFLCQIPHDETVKYHSNINVQQALECVIDYCQKNNERLLVKGHPVNIISMASLKALCKDKKNVVWDERGNVFDYIYHSKSVCVVNSGTGFESILMCKPVVCFGRAEYDTVVNIANLDNYMHVIAHADYDLVKYKKFIDSWVNIMYDTTNQKSFSKLPNN